MSYWTWKVTMRRRAAAARRTVCVAAAVVMVASGCGARLTKAQMAALDGSAGLPSAGQPPAGAPGVAAQAPADTGGASVQTVPGVSSAGTNPAGAAVAPVQAGGASMTPSTSGSNLATAAGHAQPSPGSPRSAVSSSSPLAGPAGQMCASGTASHDPGVTASTITLGNIATINGPVPGLFAGARYGSQAVAAYINSIGGVCGRKLVVDSADDQFDQATDQQEAASMADHVLSFMGSFSLQDGGIPSGAPGVPDVGESLSNQRFDAATNFSPQPQAAGFRLGDYKFLMTQPKYATATQHMALLIENTPQNLTLGQEQAAALKSIGYKFVFTDANLQPTDPTFNGDVQKMKAAGVQGVVFQATATIIGQLANAMYAAGINVVLGNWCASAYDPAYIANAGPGTAGTVLSQSLALYDGEDASQIPMVATFDQWYSRIDPGHVPDLYATYAWLSGLLLAQAINTGGAPTRAALTSGLKQITAFGGDGLAAPSNPAAKSPPSCWLLIDVQNQHFVRDPATPTGFKCEPSGYYFAH